MTQKIDFVEFLDDLIDHPPFGLMKNDFLDPYCTNLLVQCRDRIKALSRQADNMAFVINHVDLPNGWYEKFKRELEEDRGKL